jgi:hypothetical protein
MPRRARHALGLGDDGRLVDDPDARPARGRIFKPARDVLIEDALVNIIRGGPTWRDAGREKLDDKELACPSPKPRPPRLASVRAGLTGRKKLRTRREAKVVGIWPST